MSEVVKNAIADAYGRFLLDEDLERMSIAAIKAIREPTEAMLKAIILGINLHGVDFDSARDGWQAAIDEVLK